MIRAALVAAMLFAPRAEAAPCRLALVLALDVSGSVDAVEYRRQLRGVADALETPAVRAALLSDPSRPVALTVFEWSASSHQRRLLPWSLLTDDSAIGGAAARLRAVRRLPAPNTTGLGGALEAGARILAEGPPCARRVIDVSGDGRNNDWPNPVRARARLQNITVNALVILPGPGGGDPDGLVDYFRARVMHGPGAFVETAAGHADYARAMTRKLLREVEAPRLGGVPGPAAGGNRGARAERGTATLSRAGHIALLEPRSAARGAAGRLAQ